MTSGQRGGRRAGGLAVAAMMSALLPVTARFDETVPARLGAGQALATAGLPRDETLYTTGTASAAPSNFDPLASSAYTGTMGLLYEPLFVFDPVTSKLLPWLALSGAWKGPRQYQMRLRSGAAWVDSASGKQVGHVSTGDVVYSMNLARSSPLNPYHQDVAQVSSVVARGQTVDVSFASSVNHPLWDYYLWHAPVLPKSFWPSTPTSTSSAGGAQPVASGPMLLYRTSSAGACYRQDPYWWGSSQLHVHLHFEYLCDEVSQPAGQQLSALLSGRLDWTNSLVSGASNLSGYTGTGYGVTMYYPTQPYMLAASTEWLSFAMDRWPMSSAEFRRAIAYASNPAAVASDDYAGTVEPAGPTGLLPSLAGFIDKEAVARDGFTFSVTKAKALLRACGYKGQRLRLEVLAEDPELSNAATTVAEQLRAAGIVVSVVVASPSRYQADMASGNYDLSLGSGPGPAPTPWEYFQASMVGNGGLPGSMGARARQLLAAAGATPMSQGVQLRGLYGQIEKLFLQQLPVVPLWYSGAWFEASTSHWDGYPSSAAHSDHYTPVMWPGWLGSTTTVLALGRLFPHRGR